MTTRFATLLFALQGFAFAQEKIPVPLSNPGQPVTLKIHLTNGSVTVVGGPGNEVSVETGSASTPPRPPRQRDDVPAGMKRIDFGRPGLNIEEKANEITIDDHGGMSGNITIKVPTRTTVQAKTISGAISISSVEGSVEAEATNGSVTLTAISGAVVAHSLNGGIKADIVKATADQPMSFTSLNGKIDVTLPAGTKAKLRLKTQWGEVYSDFDMKMEPNSAPVVEDSRGDKGKYRVKMDRSVTATINGGGPEYLFQTMNGSILIHKK